MPLICYQKRRFDSASMVTIDKAISILEDYARQGYDLTLRQLYYQFVSRGIIANKDSEYKRLGSIVNDARLAGLIDWDHITDRTRNMRQNSHWDSPRDIIKACATQFEIDKWDSQDNYIECWVEKDALVGVLEVACKPLDVPFFSCRGYTSQSEMWAASQRLLRREKNGKEIHIIHLGDHDPSGIDMSRDIIDRLTMFMQHDALPGLVKNNPQRKDEDEDEWRKRLTDVAMVTKEWSEPLIVHRIALNMDQVTQYGPPPNPAKITDSRARGYMNRFGDESWELDALEPSVITALIEDTVLSLRNEGRWNDAVIAENEHREKLKKCADRWESLSSKW